MATRALYVFKDALDTFIVYKHWDGYPETNGAYGFISEAIPYAWELPRFEAADFATAFIAGNKKEGGGDIYMTNGDTTNGDAMGIEYIYTVTGEKDSIRIKTKHLWDDTDLPDVIITKDRSIVFEEVEDAHA